ncbi:unnamed protein product [Cercospora beticola]|nr:unnamed protein product [Cercospora beticola]
MAAYTGSKPLGWDSWKDVKSDSYKLVGMRSPERPGMSDCAAILQLESPAAAPSAHKLPDAGLAYKTLRDKWMHEEPEIKAFLALRMKGNRSGNRLTSARRIVENLTNSEREFQDGQVLGMLRHKVASSVVDSLATWKILQLCPGDGEEPERRSEPRIHPVYNTNEKQILAARDILSNIAMETREGRTMAMMPPKKAADRKKWTKEHAGYKLREHVQAWLTKEGYDVKNWMVLEDIVTTPEQDSEGRPLIKLNIASTAWTWKVSAGSFDHTFAGISKKVNELYSEQHIGTPEFSVTKVELYKPGELTFPSLAEEELEKTIAKHDDGSLLTLRLITTLPQATSSDFDAKKCRDGNEDPVNKWLRLL